MVMTAENIASDASEQDYLRVFTDNVNGLLRRRSQTKRELSQAIGLTEVTLHRRFKGQTQFSLDDMEMIAAFFGYPLESLLTPSKHALMLDASDDFSRKLACSPLYKLLRELGCSIFYQERSSI